VLRGRRLRLGVRLRGGYVCILHWVGQSAFFSSLSFLVNIISHSALSSSEGIFSKSFDRTNA
jgi:hypothetical protein